jgi:hypothetical protein
MTALGKLLKAEQIVNLLREIDVMTAKGKTLLEACKQAGISDKSYKERATGRGNLLRHQGGAGTGGSVGTPLQRD